MHSYCGIVQSLLIPSLAKPLEQNVELPFGLLPTDQLSDVSEKLGVAPFQSITDNEWFPGKMSLISDFYISNVHVSFIHINGLLDAISWTYGTSQATLSSADQFREPDAAELGEPLSRMFFDAHRLAVSMLHPVVGSQHMILAYLHARNFEQRSASFFESMDPEDVAELVAGTADSVPSGMKYSPVFTRRVAFFLSCFMRSIPEVSHSPIISTS